jgi:hypothetical protein
VKKDRLKGLSTADLVEYGFIPESVLHIVGEESPGLIHPAQICWPFTHSSAAPPTIALRPRAHPSRAKECSRQAIPQALRTIRLRIAIYGEGIVCCCRGSFEEGRQCTSSA